MNKFTRASGSLCVSLLAAANISLANQTMPSLSLQEFVIDVIDAHPQVHEQVHILRQAQQDQVIAKSEWRPSVDLLASHKQADGDSNSTTGFDSGSSNRVELSLTQNLFNGFNTRYRMRQSDARTTAALYELMDTADNIALDAVQAYVDALKQRHLLSLAEENVASHVETLEKIQRRSNSGAGRRSQLEHTEGRVARAKASLVAQKNNMQDSLTRLHELLGRYVSAEELIAVQEPESPWQEIQIDDLISEALENHPALKVASANISAAEFDQRRAHSTRYPKLDLRLATESGDDLNGIPGHSDETSATLNLTYNLYRGGADRA